MANTDGGSAISEATKSLGSNMTKFGMIADAVGSFIPQNYNMGRYGKGKLASQLDSTYDNLSNAAMSLGPYGQIVGGAMKGAALLNKGLAAIGGGTDQMTNTDAILNSNFLGWTPIGMINGFGGSKANTYNRDDEIDANSGGSYQGFLSAEDEASAKSGKKYGLFSRGALNKANELIDNVSAQQLQLGIIEDTNKLNQNIAQNNASFVSMRSKIANDGGLQYARIGKEGMTFDKAMAFAKHVLQKRPVRKLEKGDKNSKVKKNTPYSLPELPLLKQGGSFNVIPDGSLHKNKHHLDEIDEKFEDVTTKGIPVITEKNGEVIQHAEVEKEEIIFRLETTKKIEELMKKGTDEAAIEAGKLLVKEILHNTKDNANII